MGETEKKGKGGETESAKSIKSQIRLSAKEAFLQKGKKVKKGLLEEAALRKKKKVVSRSYIFLWRKKKMGGEREERTKQRS